jgi:DNA-binding transcriptional LysR family regulator
MPDLLSPVNLHHLQVFRVVAKKLSYSRAAEDLIISQPAVSRHVHALEHELGAHLLGQTGNRVYLTDAGRVVLAYAERVVELTKETSRALAELENLKLSLPSRNATPEWKYPYLLRIASKSRKICCTATWTWASWGHGSFLGCRCGHSP